jgi:heat shock protein HslJ
MLTHWLIAAALITVASDNDTSLRVYAGADSTWVLTELRGEPVAARATMQFPEAGVIAGQAPCNRYRAALLVPYPWFDSGPVAATRMACPDLAAEKAFFQALEAATLSEIRDDTLILSDDDTVLMVFKADD